MKKYILLLAILVVGMAIGWSYRGIYYRYATTQRDTIFVHDTTEYTKEVLAESTKVVYQKDTEYIYIEVRDTVEKEKKVYVPMPMQHYRTRVKDAEIFHSGVESKIDSLRIFNTIANITETKYEKERKHQISIYGSIGWMERLRIPVGVKYLYRPYPWWGIGTKVEHDFAQSITGAYATTELTFGW